MFVCMMKRELFYERILVYYQSSTRSLEKNGINTIYHKVLKKYRPFPLSYFLVLKKNSTALINILTLREVDACSHPLFSLGFFVRYHMQMVSDSEHLQYLTTSVHQMSAWHLEQSYL